MIGKKSTIILAVLFLSACSMIPEYTQPKPPVPLTWPSGPAYGEKETGPAGREIKWKDFYLGRPLQKVISLALQNNRDLRIAALNIERTRAQYRIQGTDLFPTISALASGGEQRVPGSLSITGQSVVSRQYSVSLGMAGYEIDFFGRIRSLEEQALQQYFATEQARKTVQMALITEVANVYFLLGAERERLRLAIDTLKSQETSFQLITRRFEIGSSSELDLRQAQTRVEAAKADIARYTGAIAQDVNILTLLVGAPVPEELLSLNFESTELQQTIGIETPSAVLLNRPDILEAEHQLKAANANIGAARAAFFPRITLTTGVGLASNGLSGLFNAGSETWAFAPQITLPIFDSGRNQANLAVSEINREISVNRYDKVIQGAFREVADALAVRGTVGKQIAAQKALVEATAETLRLSTARYNSGIDSYLPVLDAQRALYSAEQTLIGLRLAQAANLITLYKVLGGGSQ